MSESIGEVRTVLVTTLGLEDRGDSLAPSTPLLGHIPELDSMAVMELVVALEQRFGIEVEGEELTAETFETLGTLAAMVDSKLD